MGVSRFSTVQDKPYVPLPFQEMLLAGQAKQLRHDKTLEIEDTIETGIGNIKAVTKGHKDALRDITTQYQQEINGIYEMYGYDKANALGAVRALQKRYARDLTSGKLGVIDRSYKAYQQSGVELKTLKEKGPKDGGYGWFAEAEGNAPYTEFLGAQGLNEDNTLMEYTGGSWDKTYSAKNYYTPEFAKVKANTETYMATKSDEITNSGKDIKVVEKNVTRNQIYNEASRQFNQLAEQGGVGLGLAKQHQYKVDKYSEEALDARARSAYNHLYMNPITGEEQRDSNGLTQWERIIQREQAGEEGLVDQFKKNLAVIDDIAQWGMKYAYDNLGLTPYSGKKGGGDKTDVGTGTDAYIAKGGIGREDDINSYSDQGEFTQTKFSEFMGSYNDLLPADPSQGGSSYITNNDLTAVPDPNNTDYIQEFADLVEPYGMNAATPNSPEFQNLTPEEQEVSEMAGGISQILTTPYINKNGEEVDLTDKKDKLKEDFHEYMKQRMTHKEINQAAIKEFNRVFAPNGGGIQTIIDPTTGESQTHIPGLNSTLENVDESVSSNIHFDPNGGDKGQGNLFYQTSLHPMFSDPETEKIFADKMNEILEEVNTTPDSERKNPHYTQSINTTIISSAYGVPKEHLDYFKQMAVDRALEAVREASPVYAEVARIQDEITDKRYNPLIRTSYEIPMHVHTGVPGEATPVSKSNTADNKMHDVISDNRGSFNYRHASTADEQQGTELTAEFKVEDGDKGEYSDGYIKTLSYHMYDPVTKKPFIRAQVGTVDSDGNFTQSKEGDIIITDGGNSTYISEYVLGRYTDLELVDYQLTKEIEKNFDAGDQEYTITSPEDMHKVALLSSVGDYELATTQALLSNGGIKFTKMYNNDGTYGVELKVAGKSYGVYNNSVEAVIGRGDREKSHNMGLFGVIRTLEGNNSPTRTRQSTFGTNSMINGVNAGAGSGTPLTTTFPTWMSRRDTASQDLVDPIVITALNKKDPLTDVSFEDLFQNAFPGAVLGVSSTTRTKEENDKHSHSVDNSDHLSGKAIDISRVNDSTAQLKDVLEWLESSALEEWRKKYGVFIKDEIASASHIHISFGRSSE